MTLRVLPVRRRQTSELVERLVRFCGSRTCKPNSVCRIAPAGRSFLWAAHYCVAQATYPEVVARRAGTRRSRSHSSLPIWSCSVWGLPCPPHCCDGGALLPHLFTLTSMSPPGRYVFCGTFRRTCSHPCAKNAQGWGTLPDVIRHTALWSSDFPPASSADDTSDRPVQLPTLYCNSRGTGPWSFAIGRRPTLTKAPFARNE